MKFKLVPPPPDSLDAVAAAQRAVPLVPGSETDCCSRLETRLDLPSRDVARTWLTFLRALDLVRETEDGSFVRTQVEPTRDYLRDRLHARVYAVDTILDELADADRPLDADAVFERVRDRVPTWETYKQPGRWEETWRERVGHLLGWLVLVDLVQETDEEYEIVGSSAVR